LPEVVAALLGLITVAQVVSVEEEAVAPELVQEAQEAVQH
jgi:hypothetical protein